MNDDEIIKKLIESKYKLDNLINEISNKETSEHGFTNIKNGIQCNINVFLQCPECEKRMYTGIDQRIYLENSQGNIYIHLDFLFCKYCGHIFIRTT
jgi:hypothetical protein